MAGFAAAAGSAVILQLSTRPASIAAEPLIVHQPRVEQGAAMVSDRDRLSVKLAVDGSRGFRVSDGHCIRSQVSKSHRLESWFTAFDAGTIIEAGGRDR